MKAKTCLYWQVIVLCFAAFMGTALPAWAQIPVSPEVTSLTQSSSQLTIAALNVHNLDPKDTPRFKPLADLIIHNLKAPDILALSEIQDNDGPAQTSTTSADLTFKTLIDAIATQGGPHYQAVDIAPESNQDGGEPGGNIRVGYLFQPDRVALTKGIPGNAITSVSVITGPHLSLNPGRVDPTDRAFDKSRKPLAVEFVFKDNPFFLIANHFISKRGGSSSDLIRQTQAGIVNDFVEEILIEDPNANVVVLGDLNDFEFSDTLATLEEDDLQNLADLLSANDRFSYKFRGKLQLLDHILVSQGPLFDLDPEYDIVHAQVGFSESITDHDPVLARFTVPSLGSLSPKEIIDPQRKVEVICPGLSGTQLRECLVEGFSVKTSLSYNKARDFMFAELDNVDGKVRGIYTDFAVSVDPNSSSPRQDAYEGGINTEHSWPQSKGASESPARSDLHHLYPSKVDVNSYRSSHPFGDLADQKTERWFLGDDFQSSIPNSTVDAYSEGTDFAFEPRESVKGDIARSQFYFFTVYHSRANKGFFNEQKSSFCQWNKQDPVDAKELARTNKIATRQGNENPFVLDPDLADRLYCLN